MTKEELKKTIDIVTGIDIHSEAEATAKEELMSYAEQLQQENENLKEKLDISEINYDIIYGYFAQINKLLGTELCEEVLNKIIQLQQENEELKKRLNWIAFGDDVELALRYLRRIGYVDFDEKRKFYINKHNDEPFWLNEEKEKNYYIKDEELNDYTKQLEQENQELKKQIKLFKKDLSKVERTCQKYNSSYYDIKLILTEFEKWLEEKINNITNTYSQIDGNYMRMQSILDTFKECLDKLQEHFDRGE